MCVCECVSVCVCVCVSVCVCECVCVWCADRSLCSSCGFLQCLQQKVVERFAEGLISSCCQMQEVKHVMF